MVKGRKVINMKKYFTMMKVEQCKKDEKIKTFTDIRNNTT